ncbi:DUF2388 domain-containing protein [Pseudomonas rubra]|uniref:DUF2388 domain-containing protein n=1 Tax=Pseudomonas rubra TaxID=2942627 RepID=A0ABT5PAS0_9PSED|nr:DUF2388 domain-containing protein [Pseudomonas rubra]MDD1015404.1 DUF2388 domain-containing protein [Pseudomonas rubra]MDD1039626.1 DUF2388 domain-containing protein [Pseudomonas rubra]MDD1153948.1 DUF2388 domain-containing protein [Pseudomonas rubra]
MERMIKGWKKPALLLSLAWCCTAQGQGDIFGSGGDVDGMLTLGGTVYLPFMLTGATTFGPTMASEASSGTDGKRVLAQAHDDAAAFIASDGAYRGAYLQSALSWLRSEGRVTGATDHELAQEILVLAAVEAKGI